MTHSLSSFIRLCMLAAALLVAGGVAGPVVAQTGPGGVGESDGTSSLELWLRADEGVTTSGGEVTDWADQSGNGNNATQSSGDPVLLNSAFNGKPAVEFVASDQDVFDFNNGSPTTELTDLGTGNNTILIVSKRTGSEDNQYVLTFDNSCEGFGCFFNPTLDFLDFRSVGYNTRIEGGDGTGSINLASVSGLSAQITQAVTTGNPTVLSSIVNDAGSDPTMDLGGNNEVFDSGGASTLAGPANDVLLGALSQQARNRIGGGGGFVSGEVAEVIAYGEALNAAQMRILYNALSEKYGIEIAADFYAFSGNGTDVAGLGQADSSFGEAPKGNHTTANSAELRLSTNASTNFNDGEYILFGHDDAAVSFSQVERPNGQTTAQKIGREWRVDLKDASSQSVDLSIAQSDLPGLPTGFNDYAVFVDDDGDFSSGATFVDLEENGSRYEAADVSISDGDFVTIAAIKRTITFAEDSKSELEDTATPEPALPLELNYPSRSGLTLGYDVSPGDNSPDNDTDYETCCEPSSSATFTFPANQTTYDLQAAGSPAFRIIDEGIAEPNTEFVDIAVDPSTGAGAGRVAGGDATTLAFGIVDDDQPRKASLSTPDDTKAEDSGSSFTVEVTLTSAASGSDVTVGYELSGTATAGVDYENLEAGAVDSMSGQVTIPDGDNSTSFDLRILDDDTFESDETINVTLVRAEGAATLAKDGGDLPSQTFTITDDESPPNVAFSSGTYTGAEGGQVSATVELSTVAGTSVSVAFSVTDGTATGSDYSTVTTSPVTIPAGKTEASIVFDLADGDNKETTESFAVDLTSASPANLGSPQSADINIIDEGVGKEGPGGVGGPESITTWLSANRLSLGDGSEVTTWPDQSGNGNDASVSSGNGPAFQASVGAFNDRSVVRFDGSSEYIELSGLNDLGTGPNTVFAVSATNADSRQGILTVSNVDPLGGNVTDRRNLRYNTGPAAEALNGSGTASTNAVSSDGTPAILGSGFDGSSEVDVAANRESPSTSTNVGTGTGTSSVLGAEITLDGSNTEDQENYLDGDIAELVVFNQDLNAVQRTIVANYLAARYDLSASLADDYYAGDTDAGFETNVIGVGAEGGNTHILAEGSGVRLAANSLSSGDYVFLGDTTYTTANDININDVNGVSTVTARSDQRRYIDTRGRPTFDITIDLETFGLQGPAGSPSNYRLLYRGSAGSGSWSTPATVAGRSTSGDKVTFSGVQFANADEAAYITIGTTNQVASPLDTRLTTIRGTPGTDGSDEGWRYYGPPGNRDSGPVQMGEIRLRTPNGRVQTVDFRANMSFTWPRNPSGGSADWVPASPDTDLPRGRGAILFLYDNSYVPLDPELTIDPQETGTNGAFSYTGDTDVTVGDSNPTPADSALGTDVTSHLLANPYEVTYDLDELKTLGQDGDTDGTNDWQTAVQVWTTTDGEGSGDPRGTYKLRSTDPAKPKSERLISPGQAFFLERNDTDSGTRTEITFSASGRQENESTDFVGTEKASAPVPEAGQIKFRLQVRDDQGRLQARDRAASLYFREGATTGWDAFDAPKLTPMETPYATIGIKGAAPDGDTTLKAQESRPYALTEPVEMPLDLTVEGTGGTATLSAPEWWSIPANWSLTLLDTKGTSDPSDDEEHELGRGGQNPYTFSVEQDKASKQASDGSPDASNLQLPESLHQQPVKTRKSSASRTSRFVLRIEPEGKEPTPGGDASDDEKPLLVEQVDLNAETSGQNVILKWATPSKTKTGEVQVQRKRLRGQDKTLSEQDWEKETSVSINEEQREYEQRLSDLKSGRYAFRLRQVSSNGNEAVSERVEAGIWFDEVTPPYPNPTRTNATLGVTVQEAQSVTVTMYDMLGRRVRTVHDGELSQHTDLPIDTAQLSSGPYFLRIDGQSFTETARMTVIK